ncbi:MAG: CoA-binding protein [Planctomycetes bacterium]|nr:CoA-binding protein [Planctomycetota bacterium]
MPAVAVIGASTDRSKFGNKAVRAYQRMGWTVYPVHPKAERIEDLPVVRSVREVREPLQRVLLYLPPELGLTVLADVAAARPSEFWVNPGAESDALVEQARQLGLQTIQACAIVDVGVSPSAL